MCTAPKIGRTGDPSIPLPSGIHMIESATRPIGLGLAARGDIRDTVTYAQRAEHFGFESVWVHDSYFERDPISYLADLAPGRFAMALGSGLPLRLSQMNIAYDDTIAQVSSAIDMLRTLWAGERLTLNPNVPPLQPMFQPPHRIPLYIAGYQGRFL